MAQIKYAPGATVTSLPSYMGTGSAPSCRTRATARSSPCTRARARTWTRRSAAPSTAMRTRGLRPGAGRIVVQAVRAVDRGAAGHERADQHPELEQYLCVPPDGASRSLYSKEIPPRYYSMTRPAPLATLHGFPSRERRRRGRSATGRRGHLAETTLQNALAQSSNTAFTDLAHRVSTKNIVAHGEQLRGRTSPTTPARIGPARIRGPGRQRSAAPRSPSTSRPDARHHRQQRRLTTRLTSSSTGRCRAAVQTPIVDTHRCSARSWTRRSSTRWRRRPRRHGEHRGRGLGGRQIIAKTGTTSNSLSGFFIGAIPQYSLVVGMFVNPQNSSNSDGEPGRAWRRRFRRLLAREDLEHVRPGRVRQPDAGELPEPRVQRPAVEPGRPAAEGEAEEEDEPVHPEGPRQDVPVPAGCQTATPTPTPTNTQPSGFPTSRASADATPTTGPNREPDANRHAQRPRRRPAHRHPVAGTAPATPRRRRAGSRPAWPSAGCSRPAAGLAAVDDRVETTA